MTRTGRRGGMLATIIVAGSLLVGAAAAQEDCVGLQVTPARLEADGSWTRSYDAVIRNCTDQGLRVTTSVTGLGHDLDGAPEFLDSSSAEDALRVTGGGAFTLAAGEKRTLRAEAEIQRPARSLYAGIVAEFEPLNRPAGTSIETRSRVAGMLLMRGPKPWKRAVKVVDIGVTPNGNGSYTVHAALQNVGNVHVAPTGSIRIVKDGTLLTTVDAGKGTLLPGFKRRLVGQWTPPKDLGGRVTLNADVVQPSASGSAVIDFTDGEAEVPSARITSLVASDADGAFVEVTLQNTGLAPITPTVEVVIEQGEFERGREIFSQTEPLASGETRTMSWEPPLADGTYRVTARATQDETLLDEKVTGLRIGPPAASNDGSGMPPWVLIMASFLLLGVVGGLMFVVARKRLRGPKPAAQPRAPEPARAPVRPVHAATPRPTPVARPPAAPSAPAPSAPAPSAPAPSAPPAPAPAAPDPQPFPGEAWPTRAPVEDPEDRPVPVGTTNAVAREPMIVLRLRR